MNKNHLDAFLVPLGLSLMLGYHIWLLIRVLKQPDKTVIGANSYNRKIWVKTMMEDTGKNGVLAVQTLRNNIMASTLLASAAIMLCSLVAILMSNAGANIQHRGFLYGDSSASTLSVKCFSIMVCFMLAFLFNIQSIRYYSHASILINVPIHRTFSHLTPDYVGNAVNRGSYFWSLGLRAYYFSFPLFLWVFGPVPMFVSCILLVSLFCFLDKSSDYGIGREEETVACN